MPHEPDTPRTAEEAHHWLWLYGRIVDFEEEILARMEGSQRDLPSEVQEEVQHSNIEPMRALIADYRERVLRLNRALLTISPDDGLVQAPG